MPSDISATVTAIQGKEIATTTPTDGQLLTWNNTTSKWEPKDPPSSSPIGLRKDYITSSGTWTAPSGVTNILVIAAGGGGGGGGGGGTPPAGGGGGGALQQVSYVAVTPSTNYTVTIGAGGSGGSGSSGSGSTGGSSGSATTLANGGTVLFSAAGAGGGGPGNSSSFYGPGGLCVAAGGIFSQIYTFDPTFIPNYPVPTVACGGAGQLIPNGVPNPVGGYSVGTHGTTNGGIGGGGGGAGPQGNGGSGSNGVSSGNASAGSSASANTGAGGGGGGGGGSGGGSGGGGGTGGSGYMYIIY